MAEVASAYVSLLPSAKGFGPALGKQIDGDLDRAGKKGGGTFLGGFKGALVGLGAVVGVGFLKDALVGIIGAASTAAESVNAVQVSYGAAADEVLRLGDNAASGLALSSADFNKIAVRFSGFAGDIAGDGGNVAGVLDELTTRGVDFASVYDLDVADALALFQSGLAGESEPLRQFGVDLSAAATDAFAYSNGIAAAGEPLTEQQKVQARYGALLEQTSKVQGDFANTSESLANQQRRLGAELDNVKVQLGTALLPAATAVASFLTSTAVPAFRALLDGTSPLSPVFAAIGAALSAMAPSVTAFASGVGSSLVPVLSRVGPVVAALGAGFASLGQTIMGFVVSLLPTLTKFGQQILGVLGPALTSIGGLITGQLIPALQRFLPAIQPIVNFLLNVLGTAIVGALKGVVTVVQGVVTILAGIFSTLAAVLTGDWRGAWEGIKQIASGAFKVIVGAVQVFLNIGVLKLFSLGFGLLRGIVTGGMGAITGLWSSSLSAIQGLVGRILTGIVAFFRGQMSTAASVVRSALDTIRLVFAGVLGGVRATVQSVLAAVVGFFRSQLNAARSAVTGALGNIRATFSAGLDALRGIAANALSAMVGAIRGGVDSAVGVVRGVPGQISSALGNLGTLLRSKGQDLIEGLIGGILNKIKGIKDAMSRVTGAIGGFLPGSPIREGPLKSWNRGGAGKRLAGLLASGIDSSVGDVRDASARLAASVASPRIDPMVGAGGSGRSGAGGGITVNADSAVLRTYGADIARQVIRERDLIAATSMAAL